MHCAMWRGMRDEIGPACAKLSAHADYAEDGMDGGEPANVLEVIKQKMAIAARYGAKSNFGRMLVCRGRGRRCRWCEGVRRSEDQT